MMQPTLKDFTDMGQTMRDQEELNHQIVMPLGIVIFFCFIVTLIETFAAIAYAGAVNTNIYLKPIYYFHYYTTVQLIDLLITCFYSSYNMFAVVIPYSIVNFILAAIITFSFTVVTLSAIFQIFRGVYRALPNGSIFIIGFYLLSFAYYFYDVCFNTVV